MRGFGIQIDEKVYKVLEEYANLISVSPNKIISQIAASWDGTPPQESIVDTYRYRIRDVYKPTRKTVYLGDEIHQRLATSAQKLGFQGHSAMISMLVEQFLDTAFTQEISFGAEPEEQETKNVGFVLEKETFDKLMDYTQKELLSRMETVQQIVSWGIENIENLPHETALKNRRNRNKHPRSFHSMVGSKEAELFDFITKKYHFQSHSALFEFITEQFLQNPPKEDLKEDLKEDPVEAVLSAFLKCKNQNLI